MKNKFLMIAIAIIFATMNIYSQGIYKVQDENAESDTIRKFNFSNLVITAPRYQMPLKEYVSSVSIAGDNAIKTQPRNISAEEMLRFVPGVRIDNQANGEKIHLSIRGQGILVEKGLRGIKVLLDGIPLNDPTGLAPDLFDVDWTAVQSVEVLRGPSGSLYGSSGNAGVLNITTESGGNKPFGGKVFFSGGSNNFWKGFGEISGSDMKTIDYRVSYSRTAGDGYREHSAFAGTNLSDKITWHPVDNLTITQVFFLSDYFRENAEGIPLEMVNQDPKLPNPDAIPMNEYQHTKRMTGGMTANYVINDQNSFSLMGFIKNSTYIEPGSKFIWHNTYESPGGSAQYNFNLNFPSWKNTISLGVDYLTQTINQYQVKNLGLAKEDSTLQSNQSIYQEGYGVFLIEKLQVLRNLNFLLSFRYDNIKNELSDKLNDPLDLSGSANFDKFTSRFGASYSFGDAFTLFANWGQGFLPPSTEELSSNPANPGGFNNNLEPATSNGVDIGGRLTAFDFLYCDLTLFYLQTDNDFDRYRIEERPLETFYRNAGSSERYGAEIYATANLLDNLNLQVAYTYSHFKYTDPEALDGNWLPNSPEHQLSFDIAYKPIKKLTIGLGADINSKWYIFSDNPNLTQDGFQLINARVAYDLNIFGTNCQIAVFGKNLSDQKWMAFTEPDPDGNSYQPGPGREFFGQINIKF
jgi:iron complex outermembrane receptor protein